MRQSVRDAFRDFSTRFEGCLNFPYLDVLGLVTTGIGNLIDPVELALGLPWEIDGAPATADQIRDGWHLVKNRQEKRGRGGWAFAQDSSLRLTPAGIDELLARKLDEVDAYLARRFSGYATWPADAQLGTLSMAWAMGPAFQFPKFAFAVEALDFTTAADECRMNAAGNPGLAPRNTANRLLFLNAAAVLAYGWDADTLWYPAALGPKDVA